MDIILASASPRRELLLRLVVKSFGLFSPDVDETLPPQLSPAEAVVFLARKKAAAAQQTFGGETLIISADTVVAAGGTILGKPANTDEARCMLKRLSGKTHEVFTGVAVAQGARTESFFERSAVTFKPLSEHMLDAYLASGEWQGKAGGYGIQELASVFVSHIDGDYFNIMGLPLSSLYDCLSGIAPETLVL